MLPHLVVERTEKELPKQPNSWMDMGPPNRAVERTEREDPNLTALSTEISQILPKASSPAAEQPEPQRTNDLTEREDPLHVASRTDIFPANLTLLRKDMLDPRRACERIETWDEILSEPRMETAEPTVKESKTEMLLDMRTWLLSEIADPTVMEFRVESLPLKRI